MTVYRYITPLDSTGEVEYVDLSEQEILNTHWDRWSRQMQERYGDDPMINSENCIQDWAYKHSAWKIS